MLVLSRKKHEEIFVDIPPSTEARRIVVCVPEIRGDKVRIGFEADKEITILRAEVDAAMKAGAS